MAGREGELTAYGWYGVKPNRMAGLGTASGQRLTAQHERIRYVHLGLVHACCSG
jgi:hypothetical protein